MEPKIQAVDGAEVVNKLKENIEIMLRKKVMAVKVRRRFYFQYIVHIRIELNDLRHTRHSECRRSTALV